MDWERYKALCDTPDVCSRWLLEQTLELVDDPDLRDRLTGALAREPLEKPADHAGDADTDMFPMSLTLAEVSRLRQRVEDAARRGETTSGTGDRGLGGFVETWREYEQYLQSGGATEGPADCSPGS